MAKNDAATLVINSGNYFTAPVGTACPTDFTIAIPAAWENIGHTSLSDIFGMSSEGGEATVLGTLQSKALRTSYSARTETMTFTLQQFDEDSLRLFFGTNMVDASIAQDKSLLGVSQNPQVTQAAFMVVFIDGANTFAFYAPKAEIYRGDDLALSDTESLAGLPLAVKPMIYQTNTWAYAVTPLAAA